MENTFIKKYISKLNDNDDFFQGSFVKMNESIRNCVIQDVNVLTFNSMYATISVLLFNEKIIPETELENIKKIKTYLSTKDPNLKIFTNSYFGYLYKLDKRLSWYVMQIGNFIMENLYEKNENIVYIDTDMILYTGDVIDLIDIDLKYEKRKYDYFLMDVIKRYVYAIDNKFYFRGYISRRERDIKKIENYISKIKLIMRNDKLNEILL